MPAPTRLGPYEIVAPLGAGGMGEVYRARDTRLGREVAIKVLPAEMANDADRLRRFEREARAASALNHPGILTVFDVGAEAGRTFLVTELLEGRSFRDLLDDGPPIQPRKALQWAAQVARALAVAHDKGIVHRDLKPENLFLTRDGLVKILDFGLAKLAPADSASAIAESSTVAATMGGLILGTVGYMAPEQVRGGPVDWRADIFAFGCVVYELIAGRRAFERGTPADTLSAILRDEPTPLPDRGPGSIDPELARLGDRCLAKAPQDRWQSARDLAYRLDELADRAGGAIAWPGPALSADVDGRGAGRRGLVAWVLAALAIAVAAWALYTRGGTPGASGSPVWQRVSFRRVVPKRARVAPDGKTILYSEALPNGFGMLYSTRVDSPESTVLPYHAVLYAVSATGQLALGVDGGESNTLAQASLAGGAPRESSRSVGSADFAPGESRLAIVHQLDDRDLIELPPGTVLYDPGPGVRLDDLRFSPRGDRLAFSRHSVAGGANWSIALVDLSGHAQTLTDGWAYIEGVAWHPRNGEIWFSAQSAEEPGGATLYGVAMAGAPRLVASVPGLVRIQDFLPDGRALLLHSLWRSTMVCKAPGSGAETDASWLDFSEARDLSDDGRTVLFVEDGIAGGGKGVVYLRPTTGGDAVRLGEGDAVALSRDGQWVLAGSVGARPVFRLLPTGPGQEHVVTRPGAETLEARLLPDGRAVLLKTRDQGNADHIGLMSLEDDTFTPVSSDDLALGPIAPDGRRAAVRRGRAWQLLGLDGTGSTSPLSGVLDTDVPVRFSGTGAAIFVRSESVPSQVRSVDIATGRSTLLHSLAPALSGDLATVNSVVLSADGQAYCYSYVRDTSDLYVVAGLR